MINTDQIDSISGKKCNTLFLQKYLQNIWTDNHSDIRIFIHSRVKDGAVTDDLMQDVFLKVLMKIHTLHDKTKIRSWIYQIARNVIIDYFRKQRIVQPIEGLILSYENKPDPEPYESIYPVLLRMLDRLPESYRIAICLNVCRGLSQKHIAKKLGLSYSGVKSRIQRARQLLKNNLLNCCHFERDRLGNIIDYHPIICCCCHQYKSHT